MYCMTHDQREELYELLVDLYEWNAIMGYWDAPVWERCKTMRDQFADQREGRQA